MTELRGINLNGRVVRFSVKDGCIGEILPDTGPATQTVIPLLCEPHVHLDKFDTFWRAKPTMPGLFGAIEAGAQDKLDWSLDDLRDRMVRAMGEAYRAGCRALRTHIDWDGYGVPMAWDVLTEIATDWKDRVAIQRASLSPLDLFDDAGAATAIASRVAQDGGILGAFIYRHGNEAERIATVFDLAEQFGLALDFHVDEGLDVEARAIDLIVSETAKRRMGGRVLCGHACSLALRGRDDLARFAAAAASAGVALTIQPSANLYLQDMEPGRMPRHRGMAPAQELSRAGVNVMLGTDNVRDPFVPFGVLDPLQTLRLAWIAGQMAPAEWVNSITTIPGSLFANDDLSLSDGSPADFILLPARDLAAGLADPTIPRAVWRKGVALGRAESE